MALELATVARITGGDYLEYSLPRHTQVDSVAHISEIVVRAHDSFATLATGSLEELRHVLRQQPEHSQAFKNVVFVTREHNTEVRSTLAQLGVNAIIGANAASDALSAELTSLVMRDQAAEDRLVSSAMKVLTTVARRGGVIAVVVELAHRIDGWVVLLDVDGNEIASASAGRLHIDDARATAFNRPVRVRHEGLQVHRVGSESDLLAHLVVASRAASTSRVREIASQTSALLELLLRTHDYSGTERLGRDLLFDTLLTGGEYAVTVLRRWGVHDPSLTGFTIGIRNRSVELERLVIRWLDEIGATHLVTTRNGRVRGFVRNDLVAELSTRVSDFSRREHVVLSLGLGRPAQVSALAETARESVEAYEVAAEAPSPVVSYDRLPSVQMVLQHLAPTGQARLAGVLKDLSTDQAEKDHLLATLRVYLLNNSSLRSTATQLNIHRQTLSSRIRRIESLTGLNLSSIDDRSAAWLALRALGS